MSPRMFRGVNAVTGEPLDPAFPVSTTDDVDRACSAAGEAFVSFSHASSASKALLLRTIAGRLESAGEALVIRANLETALPEPRLRSELARTCSQLRMFANLVEEGSWVDARIDTADRQRKPVPKPDVRSMLRPLGPVAVFGASNFPLAFSVAGGDTASALAAGCPVVVKAHPAHPGTSELSGLCIEESLRECGFPEGVFSLLFDDGYDAGIAMVKHPSIKAVAFTGSRRGGHALVRAVSERNDPIPVYAEMGSVNPVFVLAGALNERSADIAAGLHASVTQGVGQFCTNPGLVVLQKSDAADAFVASLEQRVSATPVSVMLTAGICASYMNGVERLLSYEGVSARARVLASLPNAGATLFTVDAKTFLSSPELAEEVFGPATIVVECASRSEMLAVARSLEGQLTATIHAGTNDAASDLAACLERKAGRILFNGFPTGVEVGPAMVHGGPYPATSDGRSTSVGTRAIERFVRAVCYQDWPDELLPPELKEANPLGIRRMIDGQ